MRRRSEVEGMTLEAFGNISEDLVISLPRPGGQAWY